MFLLCTVDSYYIYFATLIYRPKLPNESYIHNKIIFFYDLVKLFCLFCFYHYMVNKDYHSKRQTSLVKLGFKKAHFLLSSSLPCLPILFPPRPSCSSFPLPSFAFPFFSLLCSPLLPYPFVEVKHLNSVWGELGSSAAKQFLVHFKSKSAHSVDYNTNNSFTLSSNFRLFLTENNVVTAWLISFVI